MSLIRQFEDLARRKEEIHKKQRPLLEKLKEIKAKIGEHIERKDAVSVSPLLQAVLNAV